MPLHRLQAEWDTGLTGGDPLHFPGYDTAVSGIEGEAVRTGTASIDGGEASYAFIDCVFGVLGGSMGAAVGEKVVRAYHRAVDGRLPVVVRTASGGARMQEGMVALIQMARTTSAAVAHARAGLLSLAVLGAPTTGGVFASFGSLTDIRAATPGALIGFAGPRVVELVTGEMLPPDSHTAESAYANGFVDALVAPEEHATWVECALGHRRMPLPRRELAEGPGVGASDSAWVDVLRARRVGRPSGIDRAAVLCDSFVELRGRDPVLRAGLAEIGDRRVVVLATDRYARSPSGAPGRPGPLGFRLAQRVIALAGRLGLPLLTLVDTPGADPGPVSEAGDVAGEIARTFAAMAALPTPSVSVCVGEGGSGGALALAHADRLLIQDGAYFSVIAPEAAAVILRREPDDAPQLAESLGLRPRRLVELGIVDGVVGESDDALRAAVLDALADAVPGDRDRRIDVATARWVR